MRLSCFNRYWRIAGFVDEHGAYRKPNRKVLPVQSFPADLTVRPRDRHGLTVEWLIETHVHAGHLSGAPYLEGKLGGKIGIGNQMTIVQDISGEIFNESARSQRPSSSFPPSG